MDIIRLDIKEINNDLIKKILDMHNQNAARYQKLKNYYLGQHDILNRTMVDISKPNNKLVNNYPSYIVDVMQGYFVGEPIRYSSTNEEYMRKIQDIFDYNDEQDENSELAKMAGIFGHCYELLYIDEDNNIRFNQLSPEECILVYNTTIDPEPKIAIRFYDVSDGTNTVTNLEVYTEDMVYYYVRKNGDLTLIEKREHYFGGVPIIEFPNNNERIGDFEKVITLIDAYDKVQSDTLNDLEYFADAYLKIKNMSGTTQEDIKAMKNNRVILVEGDGDADWLIKNMNDTVIENFKKRLQQDIHRFSKVPNLTDEEFAGNLSGVALKYKLWGMEQAAAAKERKFKRALQRRIELITNILNIKGGNYDWRDIQIIFTRNIPQNVVEIAQMINSLRGLLSNETLISQLPFVEDPKYEIEKINEEQEVALNYQIPPEVGASDE